MRKKGGPDIVAVCDPPHGRPTAKRRGPKGRHGKSKRGGNAPRLPGDFPRSWLRGGGRRDLSEAKGNAVGVQTG